MDDAAVSAPKRNEEVPAVPPPEERKEDIPTADPVFIHLVPFVTGDDVEASTLVVQSGFARTEDSQVHRLSRIVLQLAVINFMLALFIEFYLLVLRLIDGYLVAVVFFLLWVGFAYYVMWLGIQGVRTRNAPCCDCCQGCGFLQAFMFIYVIFAFLRSIRLFIAFLYLDARQIVTNFLLLVLTGATAEYSRKLLIVINKLPPIIQARVPPRPHDVPMALASEVDPQTATASAERPDVVVDP